MSAKREFPRRVFGVPVKWDATMQPNELRWDNYGVRANPAIGLRIAEVGAPSISSSVLAKTMKGWHHGG